MSAQSAVIRAQGLVRHVLTEQGCLDVEGYRTDLRRGTGEQRIDLGLIVLGCPDRCACPDSGGSTM